VCCSLFALATAGHHDAKVLKIDKALAVHIEMVKCLFEVNWIFSDATDLLEARQCL
jgi:hypothetical protein